MMTMLLVVYRHSLEEDIQRLLKDLHIKAFTETPRVFGMGAAGQAFDTFEWPGVNSMIMIAMEFDMAERVIRSLRAFRDDLSKRQKGVKIPLRVFSLPCEQAL